MARSKETDEPSPISPLRRVMNVVTSHGLLSPELRDIIVMLVQCAAQ